MACVKSRNEMNGPEEIERNRCEVRLQNAERDGLIIEKGEHQRSLKNQQDA